MTAARAAVLGAGGTHPQHDDASRSRGPEATAPARPAHSDILIGRFQRSVVVTVHGELDGPSAAHLDLVLGDLIDGQGNLSVVVDLHDATAADADRLMVLATVLAEAAERARRRGGAMTFREPPAPLDEALREIDTLAPEQRENSGPASPTLRVITPR